MTSTIQASPCIRLPFQHVVLALGLTTVLVLAGCMSIESQNVAIKPLEPLEPICHEKEATEGCWMVVEALRIVIYGSIAHQLKVKVHLLMETPSVPQGKLSGFGSLALQVGKGRNVADSHMTGTHVDGLAQGRFQETDPVGGTDEGPYVDNRRHGLWISNNPVVGRSEGMYENGLAHGRLGYGNSKWHASGRSVC